MTKRLDNLLSPSQPESGSYTQLPIHSHGPNSSYFCMSLSNLCTATILPWVSTPPILSRNMAGSAVDSTRISIYHVTPTIVVKTIRHDRAPEEEAAEHLFLKEAAFYKRLNKRTDRCLNILECFLMLPDHLFLPYCMNRAIAPRFYKRQEREIGSNGFYGRLIKVNKYEDPALITR